MVTTPSWRSQRRMTCAGVLPCVRAISAMTGLSRPLPRVSGDHASCRMPARASKAEEVLLHEERVELHLVHRGDRGGA